MDRRKFIKQAGAATLIATTTSNLAFANTEDDFQDGKKQKEETNQMKVILLNGSPHKNGNTFIALSEISKTLQEGGVTTEIVQLGTKPVQGCIACGKCREVGYCVFKGDAYMELYEKLKTADGIVIGSPVYYAGPNGALCALLDRLFFSASNLLAFKPGASVAVCRRGGASATFDRLNKYFTINNMPVVSSQYWNSVHGQQQGEASQDSEGLQTMRTLARNMIWMIKSLKTEQHPTPEKSIQTNFIR